MVNLDQLEVALAHGLSISWRGEAEDGQVGHVLGPAAAAHTAVPETERYTHKTSGFKTSDF